MKRTTITLILLVVALNIWPSSFNLMSDRDIRQIDEETIRHMVNIHVPEKFRTDFIRAVGSDYNLAMRMIAIGYTESDWFFMESLKPNRDGTVDLGPLALNSGNIENEAFMEQYRPDWVIEDEHTLYMVVCINLYKDLREIMKHPSDIYLAYNGGIGAYLRDQTPEASYQYREKALVDYNRIILEYTLYRKKVINDLLYNKHLASVKEVTERYNRSVNFITEKGTIEDKYFYSVFHHLWTFAIKEEEYEVIVETPPYVDVVISW